MTATSNMDAILKVLKRAPKRGLTSAQIAERAGLNLSSTRTTLWDLRSQEAITLVSTSAPKGVGRPANLYTLA